MLCVCAAGYECCYMCLWVRVFELSAIIILRLPPSELSKAHLGSMYAHMCVRVRMTAATDSSVKSPGVPVKVLIRLVQIKWRWHSLGIRGGGAIPLRRRFQILLIIHQLGWINHSPDSFDWFLWTACRTNKGSMQICVEEWSGGDTEEIIYLLQVWIKWACFYR